MAGLFDKAADLYVEVRPNYPKEWFSWLAHRTPCHALAWDVATGNGQAAVAVAEHYDQVIATDISKHQLNRAIHHPRVKYLYTPPSLSNNDLTSLIQPENNSFDLITVAQAVHWFDLPSFYSMVNRVLRKPGGILAVWGYKSVNVTPTFDRLYMNRLYKKTIPYKDPRNHYVSEGYKTLPFPFEDVGLGREGDPLKLRIPKRMNFDGFMGMLKSQSTNIKAKEEGVELFDESVVEELRDAWGGSKVVRTVVFKAFMIAGRVKDY